MANDIKQRIVLMAQQTGVGQFASQLCPSCDGGSTRERTLSMDVGVNGIIKFYCHRAGCGAQGQAYLTPMALHHAPEAARHSNINPLEADIYPLSSGESEWLQNKFNLPADLVKANIFRTEERYVLPIFSPEGNTRGHITRRPWDGSPADTELARNHPQWSYKALTYMEVDEPVMSWYTSPTSDEDYVPPNTYLVEDPISAMRLVSYLEKIIGSGSYVCALMGTGVNANKIAEIQKMAKKGNVSIALDADATGQAFALARKWGSAFYSCNVVVLSKDIKDMSNNELKELPL